MQKKKPILAAVALLLLILPIVFVRLVIYSPLPLPDYYATPPERIQLDSTTFRLGNNWLRKNESGNWESYIEGDAYERGLALGILHRELIASQERAFIGEIEKLLPNRFFRTLIQLGIAWFNRNLDESVPEEYLQEIYGVSQYFSEDYGYVGPKFNRILNYHAAHDIGHMVQNMNLVACTAIAQWDYDSDTPQLIHGRNFDFYFGDKFAQDKIVLFVNPDAGYKFASVTWGGFSGVVSGMNEKGLSVTLNALPSEIPGHSSTPVSLIAREVVQYAATIEEAYAIISRYEVFVSESFTIASALDQKAAVIEKTPQHTAIYYSDEPQLIVSNHFQSALLRDTELNRSHLEESESLHRFQRMKELADADSTLSVAHTLRYLRDQKGIGSQEIGMGNPMALNQLLAHHAVIFDPVGLLAYISAAPYQENVFEAYSLSNIGSMGSHDPGRSAGIDSLLLPPDPFYLSSGYQRYGHYKAMREALHTMEKNREEVDAAFFGELIAANPAYYEPYLLAGDYYYRKEEHGLAQGYYTDALTKAIPYAATRRHIGKRLEEIK